MLKSWKVRFLALAALGVLVVVGFGVYYFFLRPEPKHLQLLQPSAASASPGSGASTATAVASPPAAVGPTRFTVDPARSEAAYFAPEKLASLPTNSTAKGSTKDVTGSFSLLPTGLDPATVSFFEVSLLNLRSDEAKRDQNVQETLGTGAFPTARFIVQSLDGFPKTLPSSGAGAAFKMTGVLDVHGVPRVVTWDVTALREGPILSALAKIKIRYDDYGIEAPSIGGFVSVEDSLTLEVQIVAVAAQ